MSDSTPRAIARSTFLALTSLGLFVLAPGDALAADALESPTCIAARGVLASALARADPGDPGSIDTLAGARRRVARQCLRAADSPVPRTEPLTQPFAVAPIPPGAPNVLPPRQAAPVVTLPAPPPVVTACDPGGCWDSSGRRLTPIGPGPLMQGPTGTCTVVGGSVRCP